MTKWIFSIKFGFLLLSFRTSELFELIFHMESELEFGGGVDRGNAIYAPHVTMGALNLLITVHSRRTKYKHQQSCDCFVICFVTLWHLIPTLAVIYIQSRSRMSVCHFTSNVRTHNNNGGYTMKSQLVRFVHCQNQPHRLHMIPTWSCISIRDELRVMLMFYHIFDHVPYATKGSDSHIIVLLMQL